MSRGSLRFVSIISSFTDAARRLRFLHRARATISVVTLAGSLGVHFLLLGDAVARDLDGRYANSPLKGWFESLRSRKGPCCSDADGTALSDIDWDMKDGRYRVRIEGQWWTVPEEAVVTEPNRVGRTMVWPVYYRELNTGLRIDVRCFLPGSMT